MRKPIFIILVVLGFILPILAYATLVPCGRCCAEWGNEENGYPPNVCAEPCDPENVSREEAQPCTLCDIFRMLQMVINYVWWALLIIAPLFIIAGGIMILIAGAKPDQLESGKKIITGTIVGLAIAFLSWTILNIVFITLAKTPTSESGEAGFPWPWNEVRCAGGTIEEQGAVEERIGSNNTYCHLQIANAPDRMAYNYNTATECYAECSSRCVGPGINCERWCCLDTNRGGANNVCSMFMGGSWCSRTTPYDSGGWILNPPPGGADSRQKGDASYALAGFINCMYLRISTGLRINSISDNNLCPSPPTEPTCNPSAGAGCSHGANSCHYGGTSSSCVGHSYAVDFYLPSILEVGPAITCQAIASAAGSCDPTAWVNYETNHVHVSIRNAACGCAEANLTARQCPSP